MQLINLPFKCKATIAKLPSAPVLKDKLMTMGFFVGANIEAIRPSPLGDPIEYDLEGYRLFIRKKEGKHIELKDVNNSGE